MTTTFNPSSAPRQPRRGFSLLALIVASSALLGGCASNPNKQDIGTVSGAVVGGIVGYSLSGGTTFGTVAGSAAGSYIGNRVGRDLDRVKR